MVTSTYDEVPYTSYPFPQSNPLLLHTIAQMFGLDAPLPQTARVLEIGCAAGANIMSIASCYPNSHCVGFDNSLIQIEAGLKTMKAVGIKNLELRHLSIMDITKEFGTFDYIIAHGVLSWIPPEVQDKILEICKTKRVLWEKVRQVFDLLPALSMNAIYKFIALNRQANHPMLE
jgi:ubiquinone/menaquinone biosynthesis C-methylase UbiE